MSIVFEFSRNENKSEKQKNSVISSLRFQEFAKASTELTSALRKRDEAGRKLLEAKYALESGSIDGKSYSPLEVEVICKQREVQFKIALKEFRIAYEIYEEYKKRFI